MPAARLLVALLLTTLLAALLSALLGGCAQLPSTARPVDTSTPGVQTGGGQPQAIGPILGTVTVWLDEHGVLLWTPRVEAAGSYAFEIENLGRRAHDLTIVRWDGDPAELPARSDRALLQGLEVIARTEPIEPGDAATLHANLAEPGRYLVLSAEGTDYGRGMVTTLAVGVEAAVPAPAPTPELRADREVQVYLLDRTIFVSRPDVRDGAVTLHVQNIGPSPHDLVVVRWRGDEEALPTATPSTAASREGDVLLDALTVVARLDALAAGERATIEMEVEADFAYALVSTLPGDYGSGMSAQIFAP